MKRKLLKPFYAVPLLISTILVSGWLYLRVSAANGVSFIVGPSRLSKWAFKVGKGNPISMGKDQFIDVDGKTYSRNLITHYKSAFIGPLEITRLTKEYPNSGKRLVTNVPVDPPQTERKLRVPAQQVLKKSLGEVGYDILQRSPKLEVFSVVPMMGFEQMKHSFHDHEVLGKTVVSDPREKAQLLASFYDGFVIPSGKGLQYACFEPRHGLRATHNGKTVDLLICFTCHQFNTYLNGKPDTSYKFITDSPRPKFDQILKNAGIAVSR